jgi:hypothetical protein
VIILPPSNPAERLGVLVAMVFGFCTGIRQSPILRGFPEGDEFGLQVSHSLSLQKQLPEVAVPVSTAQQGFEIAVDHFDDSESYLRPAVIQDAFQVTQQQFRQLLERLQALPPELVNPGVQVA